MKLRHTFALVALSSALLLPLSQSLQAAPVKSAKRAKAKTIEVTVCPVMMAPAPRTSPISQVGQYKAYFCCGGCKGQFDKMSQPVKMARIKAALKIQNAKKKA